ncbi:MAG: hypothetical protein AB1649_21430 [Chloroflexota bacterium]
MPNQEQEKLKRLRERQLTDRDPLVKQRQFQRQGAVKERRSRARSRFSLSEAWSILPHAVKAPIYGLLLGIIVVIVLPYVWHSEWALLTGAGATLIFIIFGVITGLSLDWREEIKDNLK